MIYTKKENTIFEVFIGKTFGFDFADFINQTAMQFIDDNNASDSIFYFGNIELDLCFQFKSSFEEKGETFTLLEIYHYPIMENNPKFDFSIITANDIIEDAKRLENELNK